MRAGFLSVEGIGRGGSQTTLPMPFPNSIRTDRSARFTRRPAPKSLHPAVRQLKVSLNNFNMPKEEKVAATTTARARRKR